MCQILTNMNNHTVNCHYNSTARLIRTSTAAGATAATVGVERDGGMGRTLLRATSPLDVDGAIIAAVVVALIVAATEVDVVIADDDVVVAVVVTPTAVGAAAATARGDVKSLLSCESSDDMFCDGVRDAGSDATATDVATAPEPVVLLLFVGNAASWSAAAASNGARFDTLRTAEATATGATGCCCLASDVVIVAVVLFDGVNDAGVDTVRVGGWTCFGLASNFSSLPLLLLLLLREDLPHDDLNTESIT